MSIDSRDSVYMYVFNNLTARLFLIIMIDQIDPQIIIIPTIVEHYRLDLPVDGV